jgi:hypothetical protein
MNIEDLTPEQRAQVARDLGIDKLNARINAQDAARAAQSKLEHLTNQLAAAREAFDAAKFDIDAEVLLKLTRLRRPLDHAEAHHRLAVSEHEATKLALAAALEAEKSYQAK